MKIYLARHGQSRWQVQRDDSDWESPLTDLGQRQAKLLATWLSTHARLDNGSRLEIGCVRTSPLRRAQETAVPLQQALECPLNTDAYLREADFLVSEHLPFSESPYQAMPIYEPSNVYAAFKQQAQAALYGLVEDAEKSSQPVLGIAHGGLISTVLRLATGSDAVSFWLYNTSLNLVRAKAVALTDPPAVVNPQIAAVAVAQAVLGLVAHPLAIQVLLQDVEHALAVVRVQRVAPGGQHALHFVGAVAQHALQLGAEEQPARGDLPVPQAVGGLVEGEPQLVLAALHVLLEGHPPPHVTGHRQKELTPIEAEMGGVHLDVNLVPLPVAVPADEGEASLLTDRRHDLRPLGHACHVELQAQHAVVEHVLAAEAQHRPGSPVAPHDRGVAGSIR